MKHDLLITGSTQTKNFCVGERISRSVGGLTGQKDNNPKRLLLGTSSDGCY